MLHKKSLAAAIATFVLILNPALAQTPEVPKDLRTGFDTIRESDLRANLYFVASDALRGRMSLEPGDDATAEWIASEFAKAGLEPLVPAAGNQKSFLQPVNLIEYRPDREQSFLSIQRNGTDTRWRYPDLLGGYKEDVNLSAPVVFAGFGITVPELHFDDYDGVDANGKIVVVFEHEPQENDPHSIFNGTGNTRHATTRVKALNAQKHGAIALIVMPEPNRTHPTNQERVARIGGVNARKIPLPLQALADDELHIPAVVVDDAVGKSLLASLTTSPNELQSNIDKTLKSQARTIPDSTVTLHLQNSEHKTGTAWNVAGLLPGGDPNLSAETVIISAHHDHDGWTPAPDSTEANPKIEIWHGADDNGSGTVGVVQLAHAFAANPAKPKRSILFVVFAAEERGLLGAYYMAAHPLRPLDTTRAMINFDMIGRDESASNQTKDLIEIPADTTNRLNLIGEPYSPEYKKVVSDENRYVGLDLDDRFDHENALNVFFRSDQFPFVLHNVPAFWWFTGFHPDYHHTTDTADKIDYVKMEKILKLAYLTAWQFADATHTPKFVPNPHP